MKAPLLAFALAAFAGSAGANDISTGFEGFDLSGQFTEGTYPLSATFTGGLSTSVGIFPLYHSGFFSWMVNGGTLATIEFDVSMESVDLWYLDEAPGSTHSTLTFFDSAGAVISSFTGSSSGFVNITVGSPTQRVKRIELDNVGTDTGRGIIDDFTACAGANVGTNFCVAAANSVALSGATISALGSATIAADNFRLVAAPVDPGQPGIFYYGPLQIQSPFGEGFRCIGGTTVRLLPPIASNASGVFDRPFDFSHPVQGAPVVPGSTFNFQCWYRDPNGGPSGFNLSDGTEVMFN